MNRDTNPATVNLTIVSDAICPWCYIGKRRLERALALLGPSVRVRTRWQPFELNPDMPKGGVERRVYRARKFGSLARSEQLDAQIAAAGAGEGLAFRHDLMARTPNTFDAHRLIWLAGREDVQDVVVEALFRGYFTEGRDIGDHATLAGLAAEAGMDEAGVAGFLAGPAGTDEIRQELQEARRLGIDGVPCFMIDGKPVLVGAQPPQTIAACLNEMALA
jgi:predicted DsbA family dithiol-disulfide isomerase